MNFTIEQSIVIAAPMERVKPLLTELEKWPSWSPWLCLEPGTKPSFTNQSETMHWKGSVIGEGSLAIVRKDAQSIYFDLDFLSPFKSQAKTELHWSKDGENTRVRWVMHGNLPWFLFFMIGMMKGMIRMDYRRGLQRLKSIAEHNTIPSQMSWHGDPQSQSQFHFVGLAIRNVDFASIDQQVAPVFNQICEQLPTPPSSAIVCFNDKTNLSKDTTCLSLGVAYYGEVPALPAGNWVQKNVPNHYSVQVKHKGPYTFIGDAWSMLMMTARAKKHKANKLVPCYEKYVVCAANNVESSNYETEIHFPVKRQ